jgi:DNA-directed RNA polymerase specialized sigma subunit
MIRTNTEYKNTLNRLEEDKKTMGAYKQNFIEQGYEGEELNRLMQPLISFHNQLKEEVEAYERIKRGDLGAIFNLKSIGRWLIGARIALELTQKEFAEKTGVTEAQVSRDEINEYHGITLDRAQKIIDALNIHFKAEIEEPTPFDKKHDDSKYAFA